MNMYCVSRAEVIALLSAEGGRLACKSYNSAAVMTFCIRRLIFAASVALFGTLALAAAVQAQQPPFKPEAGQAGKDVVWVPSPEIVVEKMLDMAAVSPQDYVVDLGSGDGRNVIAAARRGARALGVAEKATFIEGDMFEAEFSDATVLALFLLPNNLMKLRSKFFTIEGVLRSGDGTGNWTATRVASR